MFLGILSVKISFPERSEYTTVPENNDSLTGGISGCEELAGGRSDRPDETTLDGTSGLGKSLDTGSNLASAAPNGEQVTTDESAGRESQTGFFEIVTPSGGSVDYSLTTTGKITNVFAGGDDEYGNDDIVQNDDGTWTATGYAADSSGDSYEFEGEPVAFCPMAGTFSLYLDGSQVTTEELLGEDSPSDDSSSSVDGGPIGGGGGYADTVPRERADYVARNRTDLTSALDAAGPGDTVYVPGNEVIDVIGGGFHVADGVTLASNRGIDDAPGALLSTEDSGPCFVLHGDARLTGFQLRGAGTADGTSSTGTLCGVEVDGSGEVDNNDIWGFSCTAVRTTSGDGAHVHHNVFRGSSDQGLDHDLGSDSGHSSFEYNQFEDSSHSDVIAGYDDQRTQ